MLPCAKEESAVVDYLRSARPAYLVRLDERRHLRAAYNPGAWHHGARHQFAAVEGWCLAP